MEASNKTRKQALNPHRMGWALKRLNGIGITKITNTEVEINFTWKGQLVKFFPYTGWHTGKSINDGRGIDNLINQLK